MGKGLHPGSAKHNFTAFVAGIIEFWSSAGGKFSEGFIHTYL